MKKIFTQLHWEFWPTWLHYLPMLILGPYFMIRLGKIAFWEDINPGMYNGGFIGDSKFDTLTQIPEQNIPRMTLVRPGTSHEQILEHMKEAGIAYPCIAKPDTGMNGRGVKKINNDHELQEYFASTNKEILLDGLKKIGMTLSQRDGSYGENILIQDCIDLENEFGVFYIRKPDEEKGSIYSLIQRDFPFIIGDGMHTTRELILKHPRLWLYVKKLLKNKEDGFEQNIPRDQEVVTLGSIGNHNLGVVFNNHNHLIDEQLIDTFDALSKNIDGFYYGRYDVKADDLESLARGDFKILEVNGANAEPTHTYDPKTKPFQGWRTIIWFWFQAYAIARKNLKKARL